VTKLFQKKKTLRINLFLQQRDKSNSCKHQILRDPRPYPELDLRPCSSLGGKLSEATRRTFAYPPQSFSQLFAATEGTLVFAKYFVSDQSLSNWIANCRTPPILPSIMSNPYEGQGHPHLICNAAILTPYSRAQHKGKAKKPHTPAIDVLLLQPT
jgi:hypothetical protein